jgi:hypothetical protein
MNQFKKLLNTSILGIGLTLGVSSIVSAQTPPQQVPTIVVRPKSEGGSGNTGSLGDMLPLPPFDLTVLQTMEPFEVISLKPSKSPSEWQAEFRTNKAFCIGAAQSCDNWGVGANATCGFIATVEKTTPSNCRVAVQDEMGGGCSGVRAANTC